MESGIPLSAAAAAPPEAELLAKAQGGNAFAFEEVVKRYQKRVYATARRIVRRHEVADDVTQETFVRAWQSLQTFDTSRPFGPWVCRIAANLAINQVRSPVWREDPLPEERSAEASVEPGPLTGVLDGEASAQLKAENKGVYFEIQGHTDATGPDAYNMKLGEDRAMAVRNYLHDQHGIALNRMQVISYGEAKPVADNKTKDNRAQNRRVVIKVLE